MLPFAGVMLMLIEKWMWIQIGKKSKAVRYNPTVIVDVAGRTESHA